MRGNLAECQADFKPGVRHFQVPELVLEYDCHFIRESLAQAPWNGNARSVRLERDVEMMVAGQSLSRHLREYATNHGTQGLLHNLIIGNQAVWRAISHPHVVDAWRFAVKTLHAGKGSL